ncbi:hypothetical protein B0T13DRAFT_448779 [Neurospora crassa]|nr:hypothetical protein B0T13DRAFT_448779 [Neurospora crassa]
MVVPDKCQMVVRVMRCVGLIGLTCPAGLSPVEAEAKDVINSVMDERASQSQSMVVDLGNRETKGTVGPDLRLPEGVGGLYCGPAAREIVTASGPDRFHKTSLGHNTASAGRVGGALVTSVHGRAEAKDGMKRHVAIQNHQAEDKPFQPLR